MIIALQILALVFIVFLVIVITFILIRKQMKSLLEVLRTEVSGLTPVKL